MNEEEARRSGLPLSTGGMMGETHRPTGSTRADKTGAGGPEEDAESRQEPKDDESFTVDERLAASPPPQLLHPDTPQVPAQEQPSAEVAEINARFDRIEAKLKNKLVKAALYERLDRLERLVEGD